MLRGSRRIVGLGLAALLATSACTAAAPSPSAAASPAVRLIDVAGAPSGIAIDFGAVWAGVSDKGEVDRLDPATGALLTRIKAGEPAKQSPRARNVHGTPVAIASGFGSIWAVGTDEMLFRIDPKTFATTAFPLGIVATGIAIGDDAVWVDSFDDGALLRFDPAAGKIAAVVRDQGQLQGLASGFGSLWVVNKSGREVLRFDAKSGAVAARVPLAAVPQSVAIGAGSVWVLGGGLARIDPATNAVTATYVSEPGTGWGSGSALAFADDAIWLGNVARIDPASGRTLGRAVEPTEEQTAIAVGGGYAWLVQNTKIRQVPVALVK